MAEDADPHLSAARYLADKAAREHEEAVGSRGAAEGDAPRGLRSAREADASRNPASRPTSPTAHDRAMYVETTIQQAIRRGDFDNLPGAGKPLPNLGGVHDPDWWIRRKIEREGLTGLGPPALTLRVESRELESRLDTLTRESDVREVLEDFNKRVIEARRQLQGGPPVVTPTRDVDAEISAWHARRGLRSAREADASRNPPPSGARRRLFRGRDPR